MTHKMTTTQLLARKQMLFVRIYYKNTNKRSK